MPEPKSKKATWEPQIGDVVEYVGNDWENKSDKFLGGIGIVTGVYDNHNWTPQIHVNWISHPKNHINNIVDGGLWAGNCKKLTEVDNG